MMIDEDYIKVVGRELDRLKGLADRAVAQLSNEQFLAVPAAGDNSVAVIIKHMAGNMRSRWENFLTSDGEKADRDRDAEFVIGPDDSRDSLLSRWEAAWQILFAELKPLDVHDLLRVVTIRGEPLTVLQAINRQLTHYAYHVGQIVYVAKHLSGTNWKTLSIAPGASGKFNQAPERYIKPET